ncbi:hypothetical protein ON010_g14328 [Phytophthora cinnamomi]|nr:hypothetical protein ON010_g14328 [Phytophthora cinnamomi]
MDILDVIHNEVLKQTEEIVVNYFSRVVDFRDFITTTHPAADVCVTLKLRCLSSERLPNCRGIRVTMVDPFAIEPTLYDQGDLTPLNIGSNLAQVTVWDANSVSYGIPNVDFYPGAVYTLRGVQYVGIYDNVARGSMHYEPDNSDSIRQLGPPLKVSNMHL